MFAKQQWQRSISRGGRFIVSSFNIRANIQNRLGTYFSGAYITYIAVDFQAREVCDFIVHLLPRSTRIRYTQSILFENSYDPFLSLHKE